MKSRRFLFALAAMGTVVGLAVASSPVVPTGAINRSAHVSQPSEIYSRDGCDSAVAPAAEPVTDPGSSAVVDMSSMQSDPVTLDRTPSRRIRNPDIPTVCDAGSSGGSFTYDGPAQDPTL